MNDYYVSLVADLLGCYLHFRADDKEAVRLYMQKTYLKNNIWKLPWCQVYSADEMKDDAHAFMVDKLRTPILIEAKCGTLHLADYEYLRRTT